MEMVNDLVAGAPGLGHNRPPSEAEDSSKRAALLVAVVDNWRALRPVITDAEMAAKLEDLDRQLMAEAKKVKRQHDEERFAVVAALAVIDDLWRPIEQSLAAARKTLSPLRTAWLAREQKRLDEQRAAARRRAEEAARAAQEAAEKAKRPVSVEDMLAADRAQEYLAEAARAEAAIPLRAQVRGAISGRARGLTTRWHARIEDLVEATSHYLERGEVAELVGRLANADVRAAPRDKAGRPTIKIPGCTVYSTQE